MHNCGNNLSVVNKKQCLNKVKNIVLASFPAQRIGLQLLIYKK